MNCFEGARLASDAAVKVSLGGAEVARLDLSPGPDGILSLHITGADSGVRGNIQMWAADLPLQDNFTQIFHSNPFNLSPFSPPPAGSPWRLQTEVFIESLPCKEVDERTHYYLHHFCLQLNYFQARWPLLNYNAFLDAFIPVANDRANGRVFECVAHFPPRKGFP